MRVVSWNIQYGIETERAADELMSHDELRGVDLLLLQEMDEEGTAGIADALSAGYAFASAAPHDHTGRDFGNAVVSRWPMRDDAELPLPHRAPVNGQPRSATRAVVRVGDLDVSAYSVHTEIPALVLARRIEQFAAVADDVGRREHRHVVVGGDFNTVTERGVRALVRSMGAAGLDRISPSDGSSYRRFGRDMRLDHVFCRGFVATSAGVVATTDASDHLPVWIELEPVADPVDDVDAPTIPGGAPDR